MKKLVILLIITLVSAIPIAWHYIGGMMQGEFLGIGALERGFYILISFAIILIPLISIYLVKKKGENLPKGALWLIIILNALILVITLFLNYFLWISELIFPHRTVLFSE